MINKGLRYAGIVMVVIGLGAFIGAITAGKFTLKKATIRELGNEEKFELLLPHSQKMLGKTYDNNFHFITDLENSFKAVNEEIKTRYGIPSAQVEAIVHDYPPNESLTFDLAKALDQFDTSNAAGQFKAAKFQDYTTWMDGRMFASPQALREQLQSTAADINSSLVYDKGFGSFEIKNHEFTLAKQANHGSVLQNRGTWFFLIFGLVTLGGLFYMIPKYAPALPGIKNDHIYHKPLTSLGWLGILLGVFMIGFYVLLYFYPEYVTSWVLLVDPLSYALNGGPASQWFLYGVMYTLAILVMGVRMLLKYKGNRYQMFRTASVMFFQLAFAFLIPEILASLNKPAYDFKNIWPLDYDFFYSWNLEQMINEGSLGIFMLVWGIALIIIGVPVFTYFFGKRWYCSWVCGCGGLAETLGDPFRQLSDKSLKAWRIERWLVHGVLVFAVLNTVAVLYTYFSGDYSILGIPTDGVKKSYGFVISSMFSGVIGTGFYPLMGNRVWCRFGCPLAAYLGIVQRFKSRFRITTNGGQCISCGNCSTYCEMGIDVRWYAQRGQNIVRASCVGCGVCASVCPRGVLKLENGEEATRFSEPVLIGNDSVNISK